VLESIRRQPSDVAARLACRIVCHGQPVVGGVRVFDVLEAALARADNPPEVVPVLRMALTYARAAEVQPSPSVNPASDIGLGNVTPRGSNGA
jgi:hypothetical protein